MKAYFAFIPIITIVSITSCKKGVMEPPTDAVLAVELWDDFQGDSVQVELAGKVLFIGRVTTNPSIAASWVSGPMQYAGGEYPLLVKVFNLNTQAQFIISLKDTLTIAVNLNRSANVIGFQQYDHLVYHR